MPVLAVVGAGPGLGAAVARKFGAEGFSVALIARNRGKLDTQLAELETAGVRARAYVADVSDQQSLVTALRAAAEDLGPIDVLQYSPVPSAQFLKPVLATSVEEIEAALRFSAIGSIAAINEVLPGMLERRAGSVLLINGSSAMTPNGNVTGTTTAFAALSAYGSVLHDAVAAQGVRVRQLIIPGAIGGGDPLHAPDALAERIWQLHFGGDAFRVVIGE